MNDYIITTKRAALWRVTSSDMPLETGVGRGYVMERLYLEKDEVFMTTGAQTSNGWHQVLTRHGLLWAFKTQLVVRAPEGDRRDAKKIE